MADTQNIAFDEVVDKITEAILNKSLEELELTDSDDDDSDDSEDAREELAKMLGFVTKEQYEEGIGRILKAVGADDPDDEDPNDEDPDDEDPEDGTGDGDEDVDEDEDGEEDEDDADDEDDDEPAPEQKTITVKQARSMIEKEVAKRLSGVMAVKGKGKRSLTKAARPTEEAFDPEKCQKTSDIPPGWVDKAQPHEWDQLPERIRKELLADRFRPGRR